METEKTSPPSGPFARETLSRVSSPDALNLGARLVSPSAWLLLAVALLFISATFVGSILIKVPIKVAAQGILMTPQGVKDVVSGTSGRVRKIAVKVGERVRVEQPLAEVDQPDLRQEIELANSELAGVNEQLQRVREFQSRTASEQDDMRAELRRESESKLAFTLKRRTWLVQQVDVIQTLVDLGIAAKPQLMSANVEVGVADEEIARTRNALKQIDLDAKRQKTDHQRELLELELRRAAAERKVAMLGERLGRLDILQSPYSGRVVELKLNEGEMIERGGTLLALLPDYRGGRVALPLIATLYVSSAEGKRIRAGMAAEIVPGTVKREEYGFVSGKVLSVAEMPATQEGMQKTLKNQKLVQSLSLGGAPFEVVVALDADESTPTGYKWSSSKGPAESLSVGSLCAGEVVIREETIFKLLVPAFRRFLSRFV